jgi:hypothetical protein
MACRLNRAMPSSSGGDNAALPPEVCAGGMAALSIALTSEGRGNLGAGTNPPSFLSKPFASEAAQAATDDSSTCLEGAPVVVVEGEAGDVKSCSCSMTVSPYQVKEGGGRGELQHQRPLEDRQQLQV